MKKILLLLTLLLACLELIHAQDKTYAAGGYSNLKALTAGTPTAQEPFTIYRRSSENLEFYGGNDYNIILKQDTGSFKKVWRRYYAIADGDTLYLNCKKLDIGVGFTPALVTGKYLAFKAYMPHKNTGADQQTGQTVAFGAVGALDNTRDKSKRQFPFLWALNTETGRTYMLTYGGMLHVLEPFPELTKAFMADEQKDQDEVMLEYIRKANKQ